jgi:acetate kinase
VLLFDVASRSTAWCYIDGTRRIEGDVAALDDPFVCVERQLGTLRDVGPIGYLLHHGGTTITEPVSHIGPDELLAIQRCSRFVPEQHDALYRLISLGLAILPAAAHLLFCDTAFFLDLPERVHTYALPLSLAEPSVRRYGGFGLCHRWAWNSLQRLSVVAPSRVVSVYLGEVPNVAAVRDGKPVETSIGFTPLEGLSSAHSSGDIDPTIIFQLHASGFGFSEIARMLTEQSGFSAWLGRSCTLAEIAQGHNEATKLAEAKDFHLYQIKKQIGAFVSVLGGVDAIAFVTEDMAAYGDLISSFSRELRFLALRLAPHRQASQSVLRLTDDASCVQLYALSYDKWKALCEQGLAHLRTPESTGSG